MLDDEAKAPLLIMSFIFHAVPKANLDKWTIKNILSWDICIFIEEHRNLEVCYCHNRH